MLNSEKQLMLIAWDNSLIPSEISLFDQTPEIVKSAEEVKIVNWLSGRRYDEISDSLEYLTESPLLYLSEEATNYYIGGYIKYILDQLSDKGEVSFDYPEISLRTYLASEKFRLSIRSLDNQRKKVLLWLIELFLSCGFSAGLQSTSDDIKNLEISKNVLALQNS